MAWTGWPLSRVIFLLVGAAYLMVAAQTGMFHYRQNFRHLAMFAPVLAGPVIALAAVSAALTNQPALHWAAGVLFGLGALAGLVGFYFHFRGVGRRVDGYVARNFLIGPPIILPLMFGALGVVGLFAAYWR